MGEASQMVDCKASTRTSWKFPSNPGATLDLGLRVFLLLSFRFIKEIKDIVSEEAGKK